MTSKIWTGTITQRVIKQLRTAGYTVDKTVSGYSCKVDDKELFKAMKGSNGTYLVRYVDNLFYTEDQKVEL